MKNKMHWFVSASLTLVLGGLCAVTTSNVHAQDGPFGHRAPRCTTGTASGTYGYRMAGQLVGVGPFLVNGIFTHRPDGTMDADVQGVVGNQSFPAPGTNGTWRINEDCTGAGKFTVAALNLEVTYNFIATDGGDQIELLNTNAGVVLNGYGRRIAKPGRAPSCNNGTVLGNYGGRLEGSLPNLPFVTLAGAFTHSVDDNYNGVFNGTDTINFMGQYAPRVDKGTYTLNSNCRGTGFYTDSLGNQINYVFTVVDGGDTIFFMGTDPGVAISGIGRRIK